MVSTFTPNIQLEEPARGDDVGTWDTPVNNNMTLLDLVAGGTATITLNNSNVTLSAAQFQCRTLVFNSTLTGSVTITFPTSFKKDYQIFNQCSGSSAFTVTLATTAAGGQVICAPPGEMVDVWNQGASLIFKNLGRIGEYVDYAGITVPGWVSGCTVPPYLNCDGTTFNAVTYPILNLILGGNTLPDSRGRSRATINQGAGRINGANCGIDGNTRGAAGGNEFMQSHTHTASVSDPGHVHSQNVLIAAGNGQNGFIALSAQTISNTFNTVFSGSGNPNINPSVTNISVSNSNTGNGASQNMPPTYMGGITMVRAG